MLVIKRKNQFTLVEMLIVISIISLLVALLLPALRNAQFIAKNIECSNNLRQLGFAWQGYVNDYGRYMTSTDAYCRYWKATSVYMNINENLFMQTKAYKCTIEDNISSYSYATNFYLTNGKTSASYQIRTNGLRQASIDNPTQKILMLDGRTDWTNVRPGTLSDPEINGVCFRHVSGVLILFFDCHVQSNNALWTIDNPERNWYIY